MHYYEETQERERKLTRDFVDIHRWELGNILDLHPRDKVVVEMQKQRYRREGDVDIAVWKNPGLEDERFIGIEVKCLFLDGEGNFKSEKTSKHHKQIRELEKEGWDYVYFFDFIVTQPASGWLHPQAFDGYDRYTKKVESNLCGHVVFQINSVAWKPESLAGSISHKVLQPAKPQERGDFSKQIKEAFMSMNFVSPIIVDTV